MTAYGVSQIVLGGVLCAVGLVLVATTIVAGGGPGAIGLLVGVAFAVLGAMRVWITLRVGRTGEQQ